MKRINVNLYPRDGYFFVDSDGARIRDGSSWTKVMAKVSAYRKRAGLAQGNVEAEVMAQACARNPSHCTEVNDVNERHLAVASLKTRVLRYLSFIRGLLPNRVPWVGPQDAANRSNVCASCPNNTALPEGCSSCRAAVRGMQKEILGGRKIDARLNGCSVLGESLPVSVWVDHDVVDDPALPPHCWRKRRTP